VIDNIQILHNFLEHELIEMEESAFLSQAPSPLPEEFNFERVEGMLLGLAIGDALGNTTESMLPSMRRVTHGEIRDYLPNRYAGGRAVGLPSDDSQMAFWTLEQLVEDGGLIPDRLAGKFCHHQIYGIGNTVKAFLRSYQDEGHHWDQAGQASAGNGSLMRIAPILIPHLRRTSPALWADAALAGMVTHNERAANASCVAFIHILWECLRFDRAPEASWWVDTFVSAAREIEGKTFYSTRNRKLPYEGPLWQFVAREVNQAIRENRSVIDACERWHSGAYLLETVPSVLYILARYSDNPEEAIVRAVNDTRDNDTIAAIVGAAAGALHGRKGLPARWIDGLSGRTTADDDWHMFEIIESAKQTFWQADLAMKEEDIQAVIQYLPIFERPGFSPGEWEGEKGKVPYFNYNSTVIDFLRTLNQHGPMQPFNWPNWVEGHQLVKNPELLQKVNLLTLRKLLLMHVRADRFSEGHLAAMFEAGHIVRILKRMREIQNSGGWEDG
jgi:ADP-ribosyl-[dinitrogen reductase] hydrolase